MVLIFSVSASAQTPEIARTRTDKSEVEKAWENLIKAKGGREKLYSITSILTEIGASEVRLDVFPNAVWNFSYLSDPYSPLGRKAVVCRYDLSKDNKYCSPENGRPWAQNYSLSGMLATRLAYLLETKWDKPKLLRLASRQHGKKLLDIIETECAGLRTDFVYDPENMLVTEVDEHDKNGAVVGVVLLSDYAAIDGIQMPRTASFLANYEFTDWKDPKHDPNYLKINFAFNVDYGPRIFTGPLRAGTKDDWKRNKN